MNKIECEFSKIDDNSLARFVFHNFWTKTKKEIDVCRKQEIDNEFSKKERRK